MAVEGPRRPGRIKSAIAGGLAAAAILVPASEASGAKATIVPPPGSGLVTVVRTDNHAPKGITFEAIPDKKHPGSFEPRELRVINTLPGRTLSSVRRDVANVLREEFCIGPNRSVNAQISPNAIDVRLSEPVTVCLFNLAKKYPDYN